MADGTHDFTVTDHQKNPLEELIVSWIAHALSEICQEMIVSTFSKCIQNIIFNAIRVYFPFLISPSLNKRCLSTPSSFNLLQLPSF